MTSPATTPAHVAIVGGGMAGLAAARTLRAADIRCTIFEASDRLGGQVASEHFDDITVDRGFQTLNSWYPAVKELLSPGEYSALGLRYFQPGVRAITDDGAAVICDPVRAPRLIPAFLRSDFRQAFSVRDMLALRRWLGRELSFRSSLELRSARSSGKADLSLRESLDKSGLRRGLRSGVIDPMMRAFLFDDDGDSSARFSKWMFVTMLRGSLTLPTNGMGDLSATLGRVAGADITLNTKVTAVRPEDDGRSVRVEVESADESEPRVQHFSDVILAVPSDVERQLVEAKEVPYRGVSTWWFLSDEPATGDDLVAVDARESARFPIASAAEVTAVVPEYAPGRHLIAGTVIHPGLNCGNGEGKSRPAQRSLDGQLPTDREMQQELGRFLGADSSSWELVTRHDIAHATMALRPETVDNWGRHNRHPHPRVVLGGSHHASPTIDGALRAGQRAARDIISAINER